jgi:KTSC domain
MPRLHEAIDIRWREVESSNVQAIGWDNKNGMYVLFNHGGLYLYKDVSRQRAVACFRAESVGKYVNKNIIPHFTATKIA